MKQIFAYIAIFIFIILPLNVCADSPEALMTELTIFSYLRSGAPLSFANHGIIYENIGAYDPVEPLVYKCALVKVTRTPYERNTLIPYSIRVGTYTMLVERMENACFQQTGIKSINIQAPIRTIPQNAFLFCNELEYVNFNGNSPHFIEGAAFKGCIKLGKIEFPAQLKYIGDQAFDQCLALREIYIPKDVGYIGAYAFNYCNSLEKVTFATGHFRVIPERCFCNCEKLEYVEIPEGVSELGNSCFKYSGLKRVVLPSTLKLIANDALANTPLVDIYCKAHTPPRVGSGWTATDLRRLRLHVPSAALEAYRTDPYWSQLTYIEPY